MVAQTEMAVCAAIQLDNDFFVLKIDLGDLHNIAGIRGRAAVRQFLLERLIVDSLAHFDPKAFLRGGNGFHDCGGFAVNEADDVQLILLGNLRILRGSGGWC